MKTNLAGIELIKRYEGCKLQAYLCPAGVWTIGFGHTGDVKKGDVITPHQATVLLEYDLEHFEEAVEKVAIKPSGNEFSALVSFAFNVGTKAFTSSTLLKLHNQGNKLTAANEFGKWVHARVKGVQTVLPGLVKRRAAEKALYLEASN